MNFKKALLTTLTTLMIGGLFSTLSVSTTNEVNAFVSYEPVAEGEKRIWMIADQSWWFDFGGTTKIFWLDSAPNPDESGLSLIMEKLNANGFYYADIPIASTNIQFQRTNDSNVIGDYSDYFSITVDDEYYLYTIRDNKNSVGTAGGIGDTLNNDWNVDKVNQFTATKFEDKLLTYFTCSNSVVDGYGDVPFLRMGFYDSMRQSERDFFADSLRNLPDFDYDEYIEDDRSYTELSRSEGSGAIPKVKWNTMEYQYKTHIDNLYPSLNIL